MNIPIPRPTLGEKRLAELRAKMMAKQQAEAEQRAIEANQQADTDSGIEQTDGSPKAHHDQETGPKNP